VIPSHPLVRYANLDGIVLGGVRQIDLPEQAVVVAETDDGIPLIYKTSQGDSSAYVFNFDPAQNQFFLNPLFPVLVWSAASELMSLEESPSSSLPAGSMAVLPEEFMEGVVVDPDGTREEYAEGRFGPLVRAGFYEVVSGDNSMVLACSGSSVEESSLTTPVQTGEERKTLAAGFPLSDWFMAAGLLLMVLECLLYHRRKVG
jgi:hypothetical protein